MSSLRLLHLLEHKHASLGASQSFSKKRYNYAGRIILSITNFRDHGERPYSMRLMILLRAPSSLHNGPRSHVPKDYPPRMLFPPRWFHYRCKNALVARAVKVHRDYLEVRPVVDRVAPEVWFESASVAPYGADYGRLQCQDRRSHQ